MVTIDFSKYSSIKIGPKVKVKPISDIDRSNEHFFIIGGSNNLLVSDHPPKLAKLTKNFDYIYKKDELLHIGAATPSGKVVSYCKKNNIKNFELLQKLPGTIGGIIKMNAGLKKYNIFDHLVKIQTVDGYIEKKQIKYGYRYTDINHIIYEAVFNIENGFDNSLFRYFENLRANQPKEPSAGSCFKNPKGNFAGKLLDECSLRGFRIGDAAFSQKHANFLVNLGNATFSDAIKLIEIAKKMVFEKFGIVLELEIIII